METQTRHRPQLHLTALIFSLAFTSACWAMTCADFVALALSKFSIPAREIRTNSLETEMQLSGVEASKLQEMKAHGLVVTDIGGLMRMKISRTGVVLGIKGDPLSTLGRIVRVKNLRSFWDAYHAHGINPYAVGHKEQFLNKLVQSGVPIIFLIPRNLAGSERHRESNLTLGEFEWFMEKPQERARNVIFVFGAYQAIPREVVDRISEEAHLRAVARFGPPPTQPRTPWAGLSQKRQEIQNRLDRFLQTTDFLSDKTEPLSP